MIIGATVMNSFCQVKTNKQGVGIFLRDIKGLDLQSVMRGAGRLCTSPKEHSLPTIHDAVCCIQRIERLIGLSQNRRSFDSLIAL